MSGPTAGVEEVLITGRPWLLKDAVHARASWRAWPRWSRRRRVVAVSLGQEPVVLVVDRSRLAPFEHQGQPTFTAGQARLGQMAIRVTRDVRLAQ